MNEENKNKNDFTSFEEFGEFRFREKRKRPLFTEDNNDNLYSKKSNKRDIFPTKIFKTDSSKERKAFKLQDDIKDQEILKGILYLINKRK